MFDDLPLGWLVGGGAAVTFIISFWGHIQNLYRQIISRIIVNITLEGYASEAIQFYLHSHLNASKWGPRSYLAWMLYVQAKKRICLVPMERNVGLGRIYWSGWKPMMVSKKRQEDYHEVGKNTNTWNQEAIQISFIRGFFNTDKLVLDAIDKFNNALNDNSIKRHYIKYIFGSAGEHNLSIMEDKKQTITGVPDSSTDIRSCLQYRPLGLTFNDLGTGRQNGNSSCEMLSLSDKAEQAINEMRHWKDSEDWYRNLNLIWKRGWLLYGPPGTGKTAFTRALAEDLDLPIYIFDLATLRNEELQAEWTKMMSQTPCIALIEDIDNVFCQRENIRNKKEGLTFDCFLNCVDGIFRNDGVFIIITTNKIECIDEALGLPNKDDESSRPGRIDQIIKFDLLDEKGRLKLIKRILKEHPEVWNEISEDSIEDSGAQLQERCTNILMKLEGIKQ